MFIFISQSIKNILIIELFQNVYFDVFKNFLNSNIKSNKKGNDNKNTIFKLILDILSNCSVEDEIQLSEIIQNNKNVNYKIINKDVFFDKLNIYLSCLNIFPIQYFEVNERHIFSWIIYLIERFIYELEDSNNSTKKNKNIKFYLICRALQKNFMISSEEKLVTASFSDHLKWYMDTMKDISLNNNSSDTSVIQNHINNVTLEIENITVK